MHSHRVQTVLAAGAFVTFGVASAVAVGALPRDQHASTTAVVSASIRQPAILRHAHQAAGASLRHRAPATKPVAAVKHYATARVSGTAPTTASPTATTPSPMTSHSPTAATTHHHHTVAVTKPAVPTKAGATKSKLAPRTTPSASAVQAAIQGLKSYVHSFLTPTPSQVAQFGDLVCTAYDKGDTTKQIEAEILQKVSSLPLTTILPGAANYVVRTAVKLYCPGYQSRLGSAA